MSFPSSRELSSFRDFNNVNYILGDDGVKYTHINCSGDPFKGSRENAVLILAESDGVFLVSDYDFTNQRYLAGEAVDTKEFLQPEI